MKNFWKALGIAAIAAAVVPVRFKKDEETGKKTYQSLLLSVDVKSSDDEKLDIGVNIGEGVLSGAIAGAVAARTEDVLFADDEPEAAVVAPISVPAEAEEPAEAGETEETTETAPEA